MEANIAVIAPRSATSTPMLCPACIINDPNTKARRPRIARAPLTKPDLISGHFQKFELFEGHASAAGDPWRTLALLSRECLRQRILSNFNRDRNTIAVSFDPELRCWCRCVQNCHPQHTAAEGVCRRPHAPASRTASATDLGPVQLSAECTDAVSQGNVERFGNVREVNRVRCGH